MTQLFARDRYRKAVNMLGRCVTCLAAATFLPMMAAEPAKDPVVDVAAGALYPGVISGGVKGNDAYVDGHFSIVAPAWSTLGAAGTLSGDLIFLEPYVSWGEQDEMASSLGIGWRHLFGSQSIKVLAEHDGHRAGFLEEGVMIGANVFVDVLDTQFDNRFWQLGFGVEAGTRYLEVRANYYLPLSDRELAVEQRTKETTTTRRTVRRHRATFDEPFATGHTIAQDALLTTTDTTTTTSTTTERLFRLFEDPMEGWDVEVALLVPGLDRWMDLKLIAGYYAFENQPFGPQNGGTGNVKGIKAGVELRPVPAVVLSGMWYEDERLTGSDWTVGVQLQIPFEAGDLGDGKGLWGRMADAFRPRRRHLIERIAEPVRRQNQAVKVGNDVEVRQQTSVARQVKTKVVAQTRQRIVLATTVVFVDNSIGAPGNPGTYELPLNTIQGGENASGALFGESGIVFVQGRDAAYVGGIVSQSTAFYGSGRGYPGLGGKAFHGRTRSMPVLVNNGFLATEIRSLLVDGFYFDRGANISTQNVDFVAVAGNVFADPITDAIQLLWRDRPIAGTAYIADNTILKANGFGLYFLTDLNATASITINGNSIYNTGMDGIRVMLDAIVPGPRRIWINGTVSNIIEGVGTGFLGGVRYSGGAYGQFIINNTIVNSLPAFP